MSAQDITYQRTADMRYVGQGHEVSVPLPDGVLGPSSLPRITAAFEEVYRSLYGRKGPDVPLEVINWRVVASGPRPEMNFKLARESAKRSQRRSQRHRAAPISRNAAAIGHCGLRSLRVATRRVSSPVRPSSRSASRR